MNSVTTLTPTPSIFKRTILVLCGAAVMAFNLNTFVHTANLFPGGFVGLSLLIQRSVFKFTGFEIPYSVLYLLLNAFPVFISFKYIGKKFTLFSLMMIAVSSILTDIIPGYPVTSEPLLCAIFGGLLNGMAIMLALTADATSGGTDFVAIYFSMKKGIDTWNFIFIGNCCVLVISGLLFGWETALYSIIFQFTSTQVLNFMYHRYQKSTLLIITTKPDEIYHIVKDLSHHDATMWQVKGTNDKEKTLIYAVINGEQVHNMMKMIHQSDPAAFVNVLQTKQVLGKFYTRPND